MVSWLAGCCEMLQSAAPVPAVPPEPPVKVTILHVNDTHGVILPYVDRKAKRTADAGGVFRATRAASIIKSVRQAKAGGSVMLVHCGDMLRVHSNDWVADKMLGLADLEMMRHLHFDAMALGNHEFDHSLEHLYELMAEAEMPMMSANAIDQRTWAIVGEPVTRGWLIRQAGPVRVAFLALGVGKSGEVAMLDPIATAKRLVPQIRKQADVVVALTHLGVTADKALAAAVDGIDLIVGAHSHTVLREGVRVASPGGRETLIVQAGYRWEYVGQVDLEIRRKGWLYEVTDAAAQLHSTTGPGVETDPEMLAVIEQLTERARTLPNPPAWKKDMPLKKVAAVAYLGATAGEPDPNDGVWGMVLDPPLPGARDRSQLNLFLARRGGKWTGALGGSPVWSPLPHDVDASGLSVTGANVQGDVKLVLRPAAGAPVGTQPIACTLRIKGKHQRGGLSGTFRGKVGRGVVEGAVGGKIQTPAPGRRDTFSVELKMTAMAPEGEVGHGVVVTFRVDRYLAEVGKARGVVGQGEDEEVQVDVSRLKITPDELVGELTFGTGKDAPTFRLAGAVVGSHVGGTFQSADEKGDGRVKGFFTGTIRFEPARKPKAAAASTSSSARARAELEPVSAG